jgi:hypothetical protein
MSLRCSFLMLSASATLMLDEGSLSIVTSTSCRVDQGGSRCSRLARPTLGFHNPRQCGS